MAVVTKPFDVGNTFAQAAGILDARTRNKFNNLKLQGLEAQAEAQNRINEILRTSRDPVNALVAEGLPGMAAAQDLTDLKSAVSQLQGEQLDQTIEIGRMVNTEAEAILNSANPRQRAQFALRNPLLAERFGNVDIESLTDDQLLGEIESLANETAFFNQPQELSRLLAGSQLEQEFDLPPGSVAPGTVVEVKTDASGRSTGFETVQKPPTKGLEVEVGPDGSVSFSQGGPAGDAANTKPTNNQLQAEVRELDDQLSQLQSVGETFDPSFQTVQGRFTAGVSAAKEKVGITLDPVEADQLSRFSDFKRNALNSLNLYIKAITGAQMSEAEANRLRQGFPDAGEGLFDGDSPTQFESKYKSTLKQMRLARSRRAWAIKNGMVAPDVAPDKLGDALANVTSLEAFEGTINARADELTQQFMQQNGMNEQTARSEALKLVKQEFSL